jgi:hypothetical protein
MSDDSNPAPANDPDDGGWYFDLRRGVAVPASERGPSDDMLGPYGSRAEAEHWRERVEARNVAWDESDDEWTGDPDPPT